jgi:NCS1 family nucleobase:cation symporter-1
MNSSSPEGSTRQVQASDSDTQVVVPAPAGGKNRLYNEDLAPATDRKWGSFSLFSMWLSDVHSIGGYTFAAGLFFLGLVGWQVLIALVVGICLVNVAVNMMGRTGQRMGTPFPVVSRLSFGVYGANIPALIRAIVAIAWYGIQTYLASVAVIVLTIAVFPGLKSMENGGFLGLAPLGWICFLILWVLQLLVMHRGMETIRKYQWVAGPAVWVAMVALMIWILVAAHGNVGLSVSSQRLSSGVAIREFFAAVALTVAYFSTLMLNYCDFSRFAPNQRAVRTGNFWGLPVNFTAFAVVSVIVTAGTIKVFGKAITDPVLIVGKIHNTATLVIGALVFIVATIGINIVANFVSPAYDLANVAPKHIDFQRGGLISAVLALVVLPWKLYSSPVAVNYFLGGLGAFLGPLFAIIMVDYYLIRHERVYMPDLYREEGGRYHYKHGVNPRALMAFVPSAAIAAVVALDSAFSTASPFSWFIGAVPAAVIYYVINANGPLASGLGESSKELPLTDAASNPA